MDKEPAEDASSIRKDDLAERLRSLEEQQRSVLRVVTDTMQQFRALIPEVDASDSLAAKLQDCEAYKPATVRSIDLGPLLRAVTTAAKLLECDNSDLPVEVEKSVGTRLEEIFSELKNIIASLVVDGSYPSFTYEGTEVKNNKWVLKKPTLTARVDSADIVIEAASVEVPLAAVESAIREAQFAVVAAAKLPPRPEKK